MLPVPGNRALGALDALQNIVCAHLRSTPPCRHQDSLVDHVRYICSRAAARARSNEFCVVDLQLSLISRGPQRLERHVPQVDQSDVFPSLLIWQRDFHFSGQSPRAKEGIIKHSGSIRRADQQNIWAHLLAILSALIEAIQLCQQLVQGLISLFVEPSSPLSSHRVDLIDEDNAGRAQPRLLEEVPYPCGSSSHEELHELARAAGKERDTRLSRYRLGEEGLAGTWWSTQQNPSRHLNEVLERNVLSHSSKRL
mmetsp:Transcript_613/g.1783  ORF Transcript_613/g.1783 Transcript_613/m.1783 type:complete len:253 (-) Transcript_613:1264-2022(-)